MVAIVKFLIFAHGNVIHSQESVSYDRDPLKKIKVQTDASYEDLVNAICARINIDQTNHQIKVHHRHPKCVEGQVYYTLLPIDDDTDVENLVEMAEKKGEDFIQELYIEISERSIALFEHEMCQADTVMPLSHKVLLSKHGQTIQNEDFIPKRPRYDFCLSKDISNIHREMNSVLEDPPTEMGLRYENSYQNVMIHKLDDPVTSPISPSQVSMDITNGMEEGNQTIWASSSTTPPPALDYEVFLSFRGIDTRHGFTDHLYNGLVNVGVLVFRDDDELPMGKKIGPELLKAIKGSRISIPIISKQYASSSWCLWELVQLLECMKTSSQVMLPIFYQVEPSEVRHQTGDFGQGFILCKNEHYNEESLIQEWKNTLREVASLKGWQSSKIANGHEAELVRVIVHEVLQVLRKVALRISDHIVGAEDHVQTIIKMITNAKESSDVQAIVIHGMGGIGKTTLAKLLYNRLCSQFEHCSFLANIRATSQQHKGIEDLQKQLISDIFGRDENISNIDQGATIIEDRCSKKKVLILLDDVDDKCQLDAFVGKPDWFGRGTIIIITSRRKDLLENLEYSFSYELKELNLTQSFMLFCKHAFKRSDSIPDEYNSIAQQIVSTTGGLPLAIEVIGSLLYRKEKSFWEGNLKILKEIPHREVKMKLKTSFDALDDEEKEIFLDIACLQIYDKYERELAFHVWESCGFFPQVRIQNLISLSLIKSGENEELIIHDQLRDLGRAIVIQEDVNNPGKRSRIWKEEDARQVLNTKKGTSNILSLNLFGDPFAELVRFTREQFQGITNLRFLRMETVRLEGDFRELFLNLRWLELDSGAVDDYPSNNIMDINLLPESLVILRLTRDGISENWSGWRQIKNLKVLKLEDCYHLEKSPDFSWMKELEVLELSLCQALEEIDPSIGILSKTLKILNLEDCRRLKKLPEEVGKLEELKELIISGSAVNEIPISDGYLTKLEKLDARRCKQLRHIPDSIGSLVKLKDLHLNYCLSLTKIPESIGMLKSLIVLQLPESIGVECSPTSIGKLSDLRELGFSGDSMEMLPDFSNLTNLTLLFYYDVFKRWNRALNFGMLNQLKTLIIEESLRGVSDSEEEVDMASRNINLELQLPSSLEKLSVYGCPTLQILQVFSNLKYLSVLDVQNCSELVEINGLETARSLTELKIVDCNSLVEIQGIGGIDGLQHVEIRQCSSLERIDGLEELISSSTRLIIGRCMLLQYTSKDYVEYERRRRLLEQDDEDDDEEEEYGDRSDDDENDVDAYDDSGYSDDGTDNNGDSGDPDENNDDCNDDNLSREANNVGDY